MRAAHVAPRIPAAARGYPGGVGGAGAYNGVEARGFFGSLFGLSFRSFISITFARFIYIIVMVVIAAAYLLMLVSLIVAASATSTYRSNDEAIVTLVVFILFGWIPFFLRPVFVRMLLEFVIARIRRPQAEPATGYPLTARAAADDDGAGWGSLPSRPRRRVGVVA